MQQSIVIFVTSAPESPLNLAGVFQHLLEYDRAEVRASWVLLNVLASITSAKIPNFIYLPL
jgi:hypothetical protein